MHHSSARVLVLQPSDFSWRWEFDHQSQLGYTNEEPVAQIKQNPYLQFFMALEGYQHSIPLAPSMMAYFRKRLPESVMNDFNERHVPHGLNVMCSAAATDHDDDSSHGGGAARPTDPMIGSKTT